jgi:hypothetical protein
MHALQHDDVVHVPVARLLAQGLHAEAAAALFVELRAGHVHGVLLDLHGVTKLERTHVTWLTSVAAGAMLNGVEARLTGVTAELAEQLAVASG